RHAVNERAPGRRRQKSGRAVEQRRFAAARWANHGHEFARADGQRRVPHGDVAPLATARREGARDAFEVQRGRVRRCFGHHLYFCAAFCWNVMFTVFAKSTVADCTPGSKVLRSRQTFCEASRLMKPSCLNPSRFLISAALYSALSV